LPVSFTEVLVSFNRCELLQYLHRLILASEPCRLPACIPIQTGQLSVERNALWPTQPKFGVCHDPPAPPTPCNSALKCCMVVLGAEEVEGHLVETSEESLPQSEVQAESDMELTPESLLPMLSASIRYRLLKGYLDQLPVVQSRVMRIYVSSNFHGIIGPIPRLPQQ